MENLPKPSDLLNKGLPKPQDLLKKKEPTTKDLQSGSPISTKPFDVFQTESNKKSTINVATGEVKPYVEPKQEKPKFDFSKLPQTENYEVRKKLLKQKVDKVESKGTDVVNTLGSSLNDLYAGIAKIPRYVYEAFSFPQNLIADVTNSPKVKADYDSFLALTNISTPTAPYSPLTLIDRLGSYYQGEAQNFKDKQVKYDNDIYDSLKAGNFDDAGNQLINNIAGSIPSIALMLGTSGAGNAAQLGAASRTMVTALPFASSKANEIRNDDNVKDWVKPIASGLHGLSEVVLDQSFGASAAVNSLINKLKNSGVQATETAAKDLATGYLTSALGKIQKVTTPFIKGGIEEGATQWSQNLIKKISGENPDQDLMEGVADATIVGSVTTGSITSIGSLVNPSVKKSLNSKVQDIEKLSNDLDNQDIPDNTKKIIENKISKLKEEVENEIELNEVEFEKLPDTKQEKAIELGSELDAIEKSLQNEDLSDITKQELEAKKVSIEQDLDIIFKEQKLTEETTTGLEQSPLKDVESTAKALESLPLEQSNIPLSPLDLDNEGIITWKGNDPKSIAEAYHRAKKEGSNPELVEAVENLLKPQTDAIQKQAAGQVPVQPKAPVSKEVEQGEPESEVESVTEKGKQEEVERLREEEQRELSESIPNADKYKTDGKVDRSKIKNAKDLKKFDEIYDKYDKLITPLLEQGKTETAKSKDQEVVKAIEELKSDVKKAKGKTAKTEALQTLKDNSTPEEFKNFMDENPIYEKYGVKAEEVSEIEITDDTEIEVPKEEKTKSQQQLEELDKAKQVVLNRIRKRLGNLSSGFNPDVIGDLVELGSIYVKQGVIKFKDFATQLKNDYGKDIPDNVIRDVYKQSAKKLGLGVRRTPERIATGEAVSPQLREIADETESLYQQQDYKEVQERLDQMSEAEKNALVGALANVTGELNAEGNVGVLAAIDLINMYEAKGDKANAARVFDVISKSATAFAQLLRQYGQLKSSTPQGYISIVTKYMKDKHDVDLTDAQKQAIEKLYNDSNQALNNEVDALNDLADNLTDPNYDSKKGYKVWGETTVKLEDANRKLADFLDSLKPATSESLFQSLTSIVQGNLLSLKSLIVNPFANAIQAGIRISENEVANLFDFISSVALGTQRTKISTFNLQAIKLGSKAMSRGLSKANRMLLKGSTNTEMAKFDVGSRLKPVNAWKSLYKTLTGKQAFSIVKTFQDLAEGTIGMTANLALRLLPYGDLPRNEQAKLAKLVEIGTNKFGLKGKELEAFTLKPDPESLAEAQEYGDKSTLQNSNEIYTFINNAINKIGKNADNKFLKGLAASAKFVVRGTIVPFLKTPINYAVKAVRFTNPVIPYSQAVYHMVSSANAAINIKNPKLRESAIRRHQSKMTEYLGEAVIAQSVIAAASILLGYGLATGNAPEDEKDKKEKDLMYKAFGPNMINISGLKRLLSGGDPSYKQGDTAISYNAMGILGAQIGISSSTITTEEKEKIRKEKYVTTKGKPFYKEDSGFYLIGIKDMMANLPASLNFTLNQGFAQGTGTLLSCIQDNQYSKWSNQMVKTLVTGLAVPNTVYQSFKAGNDYYRNVYNEDQVKTWGNIVKERYGDIKDLPINYDMWGKPIKLTPEGSNPYLYHVLDIFRTQKILQDKNTYYVFDLYKKTGDKSVIPSSVKDIIDEEGGVYTRLNAEQKSELQRMVGEERAKYIDGKTNSSLSMKNYDPNNDNEEYLEKQVKKIKLAYELGAKKGKRRFIKEILSKEKK